MTSGYYSAIYERRPQRHMVADIAEDLPSAVARWDPEVRYDCDLYGAPGWTQEALKFGRSVEQWRSL